jgi:phosphate transport system protein
MGERHFDEQLDLLKSKILKMAALTEEAIHKSIEALKDRDTGKARAVIDADGQIDEIELEIEKLSTDLLALRQPMARDLRFITTGMKINNELERIADIAVNISQRVLEIADKPLLKPLVDTPKLAAIAADMVKKAIDAFVQQDPGLARTVILMDPEADALRNRIQEALIRFIDQDGRTAGRAIPLFLVARHLERICDHATYIAEDIVYMVEARIVKHHVNEIGLP